MSLKRGGQASVTAMRMAKRRKRNCILSKLMQVDRVECGEEESVVEAGLDLDRVGCEFAFAFPRWQQGRGDREVKAEVLQSP